MNQSPKAIAFVGWHNAGKTTLVRQVLRELTQRGYRVGIMKSTKEETACLDQPGTDSFLHRAEGAVAVALVGPKEVFLRTDNANEPFEKLKNRLFHNVHLVLAEGFKHVQHLPKIEVTRAAVSQEPLRHQTANCVAVVADYEVEFPVRFSFDQTQELANFIQEFLQLKPARGRILQKDSNPVTASSP